MVKEQIRKLRRAGMTITEIARIVGVSPATVSRAIPKGERRYSDGPRLVDSPSLQRRASRLLDARSYTPELLARQLNVTREEARTLMKRHTARRANLEG